MKKTYNTDLLQTVVLRNANGMEVSVMNFGGIINSIKVPLKGKKVECVLGFDTFEEYISDRYRAEYPYLGAVIGRNAGRIKYGKAYIDGKEVQVNCNLGENQIHGGVTGFDSVFWEVIDYQGTTNAPTILNLTQHTYFNLNESDTDILSNTLQITADKYVPLEKGFFTPTGERPLVAGTPLDYRKGQKVYAHTDNSFVREIDAEKIMATLTNSEGSLTMTVRTNHPVLHIYAGYYLPLLEVAHRKTIGQSRGICFEAQGYADATKHHHFDSVILRPEEKYEYFTEFQFLCNN